MFFANYTGTENVIMKTAFVARRAYHDETNEQRRDAKKLSNRLAKKRNRIRNKCATIGTQNSQAQRHFSGRSAFVDVEPSVVNKDH